MEPQPQNRDCRSVAMAKPMGLYSLAWDRIEAHGTACKRMGPHGSACDSMEVHGTAWDHAWNHA
eukprot:363481-Chlamydomonas_euryale.AAC.5